MEAVSRCHDVELSVSVDVVRELDCWNASSIAIADDLEAERVGSLVLDE